MRHPGAQPGPGRQRGDLDARRRRARPAAITLSATVQNIGSAAAGATTVNFSLGGAVVGSAAVGALAAGASTTVTFNAGTRPMGSYSVTAVVDPTNTIVEQNNANNSFTAASPLVVAQAPGPDLQVLEHQLQPAEPGGRRGGHVHRGGQQPRHHRDAARPRSPGWWWAAPRSTPTPPSIAAGATANVAISGSWTATSGGATITATADATNVVAETNESNNTLSQSIVVGRGRRGAVRRRTRPRPPATRAPC